MVSVKAFLNSFISKMKSKVIHYKLYIGCYFMFLTYIYPKVSKKFFCYLSMLKTHIKLFFCGSEIEEQCGWVLWTGTLSLGYSYVGWGCSLLKGWLPRICFLTVAYRKPVPLPRKPVPRTPILKHSGWPSSEWTREILVEASVAFAQPIIWNASYGFKRQPRFCVGRSI